MVQSISQLRIRGELHGAFPQTDGTWVWDDGTAWDYHNWWETSAMGTTGGTVQNCLQLRRVDLTWDDIKCSAQKWFVCKK